MANRHGWPPSDASARLVEEGLRRSEFAFIDFRDSAAGRQACSQGSTLAVCEAILLVQSYKGNLAAVARHLGSPESKVQAAVKDLAACLFLLCGSGQSPARQQFHLHFTASALRAPTKPICYLLLAAGN